MKVLFDTSVLVAALIDSHSNHTRAFPWLLKVKRGEIEGYIGTHTLSSILEEPA
jgi:predicted nucleic acid-binding protein